MQNNRLSALLLLMAMLLFSGCLSLEGERFTPLKGTLEDSIHVGDTVSFNYILSTTYEEVLDTTYEDVAKTWGLNLSRRFEPEVARVGDGRMIPALDEILLGMKEGEQKEILVTPEKGYGFRNETLIKTLERTTVFPRVDELSVETFKTIFLESPIEGGVYSLGYWNASVSKTEGERVTLINHAENGTLLTQRGIIQIQVGSNDILVTLDPVLNSTVQTVEGAGRVVSIGEETYTVDLNHPLAGETLLLFVRVENITKSLNEETGNITLGGFVFLTSLEDGKKISGQLGKPIFLYLHAPWCSWCRRFEADVLADVGVQERLEKGFITVAVDVDRQKKVAQTLSIYGTPTMIFMDQDGNEILRIRGYRDLNSFVEILGNFKEKTLS